MNEDEDDEIIIKTLIGSFELLKAIPDFEPIISEETNPN